MPGALRAMHARKTGALIRASAVAGAVMAGASEEVTAAVASYGDGIGLAFQIVDDILDVEGASEDLGKTAGKDAAAGKPTYPALFGLDGSRRLAAACLDRALDALGRPASSGQLPALARWVVVTHPLRDRRRLDVAARRTRARRVARAGTRAHPRRPRARQWPAGHQGGRAGRRRCWPWRSTAPIIRT